jgi:Kef-type K+ transport system membrane component KefB
VGLIFAGTGLATGVIAEDLYSGLVVVVMLTTFVAPLWLKAIYRDGTFEAQRGSLR